MNRVILLLILSQIVTQAEDVFYGESNLHAFLPQSGKVNINAGFELVNDTVDILNIKESELGSNSSGVNSIGDMKGINLNVGYTINDKWYTNMTLNQKELQYSGTTLKNQNLDIYLRYQFYQSQDLSFAIDGGYKMNIASDSYVNDLHTINKILKNIAPNKKISLSQTGSKQTLVYQGDDGSIKTIDLKNRAYLAIVDTKDKGLYGRAIVSVKKDKWLFDAYGSYAEVDIENRTDSSIIHEDNADLQQELGDIGLSQKRVDGILSSGINFGYYFDKWYPEFNYQYNYIFRIAGLKKNTVNHIFNLNVSYIVNQNTGVYLGAKLMLNQFNGKIPYLYEKYSESSFSHKYGYLNAGLLYKF